MPTYDYYCDANNRKVEVAHKMSDSIHSWGELCQIANIELGDTPAQTPVNKLISGGAVISHSSLTNPEPACSTGTCCPTNACGLPQ